MIGYWARRTCLGQTVLAFGEDCRLPAFKLGLGRDIADRTVQPHTIVVFYMSRNQVLRIGEGDRRLGPIHSPFRDLVSRSSLPLLCGLQCGRVSFILSTQT
jgi:hypothetical protein